MHPNGLPIILKLGPLCVLIPNAKLLTTALKRNLPCGDRLANYSNYKGVVSDKYHNLTFLAYSKQLSPLVCRLSCKSYCFMLVMLVSLLGDPILLFSLIN